MVGPDRQRTLISVVIPTRDRAELLLAALESLTRQTLAAEAFEVLVIDNGSRDRTAEVAQAFASRLGNLRYLLAPEPGLHVGRHCGLRQARGDILVFADDDIEALPTWLAAIQQAFSDPGVAMVGGNNLPKFAEPPPPWLAGMWQRANAQGLRAIPALSVVEFPGTRGEVSPYYIWGCNFAIRKEVLLAAGGFHPDGMPKDRIRFRGDGETHVSRHVAEAGLKCVFDADASVYHLVTPERMTFAYFRQRGFNQGVSDSYTDLREKHLHGRTFHAAKAALLRLTRRAYRRLVGYGMPDADAEGALKEMDAGYAEGYAYHRRQFKTDREVRAWVLKGDYL